MAHWWEVISDQPHIKQAVSYTTGKSEMWKTEILPSLEFFQKDNGHSVLSI